MIAARVGQETPYILPRDKDLDPSDQTIFQLRALSAAARAKIQDAMVGFDEQNDVSLQCPGTGMLIACKYGVSSWKNMHDHEGKEVFCKAARTHDGFVLLKPSLDAIADVYMEIGGAIVKLNKMDEDEPEEGKLGNAPGSGSSQTSPPNEQSNEKAGSSPTSSDAPNATALNQSQATQPAVAAVES